MPKGHVAEHDLQTRPPRSKSFKTTFPEVGSDLMHKLGASWKMQNILSNRFHGMSPGSETHGLKQFNFLGKEKEKRC